MNELLLRRRSALGKSIPPESKIEYLEATGIQWIDTGIIPIKGYASEIDFQYTVLENGCLFGCVKGASPIVRYYCYLRNRQWQWASYTFYDYNKSGYCDLSRHTLKLDGLGKIYQDGVQIASSTTNNNSLGYSIYLFARNNSGSVDLKSKLKIYGFKVYSNSSDLVLDMIPYRVGQVGYMYDKVSGNLFGNAGIGSFVLGPDKTN